MIIFFRSDGRIYEPPNGAIVPFAYLYNLTIVNNIVFLILLCCTCYVWRSQKVQSCLKYVYCYIYIYLHNSIIT